MKRRKMMRRWRMRMTTRMMAKNLRQLARERLQIHRLRMYIP
jgi:hypothetical protein